MDICSRFHYDPLEEKTGDPDSTTIICYISWQSIWYPLRYSSPDRSGGPEDRHCRPLDPGFTLIIFCLSYLWPSLSVFYTKNYNKVLFCRAITPFRFSEVLCLQLLLCGICRLAAPQCIYPSSFMPEHGLQQRILSFYGGKADYIGGHDKKFAWGGSHLPHKSGCPLQRALWKQTLSIVCFCSLITTFMGTLYSHNAILISSLLIMPEGKADWVCCLFTFPRQSCLGRQKFYSRIGEWNLSLSGFI